MNRVREDGRVIQPQELPYPPTSTSQKTDAPLLGKLSQQRSDNPAYLHPQLGNSNQLPPIRNLVPGLWEPGTSKSSQQTFPDEGQGKNVASGYRLRPVGPTWNGRPANANDGRVPLPQLETSHHENESNRDAPRQVKESNKRPPSSPIERADHTRTAPSNTIAHPHRWSVGNAHRPTQKLNQTGERPIMRHRSNSEVTRPTGELPGGGPQSPHQELLRDPVSRL